MLLFKQQSAERIKGYQAEIAHIKSLLPYNQMTMEDFFEAHPEHAITPEKPSLWPHGPEDQLDHKPEENKPAAH